MDTPPTTPLDLSPATLETLRRGLQELLQQRQQLAAALQEADRRIVYQQGGIDVLERLLAGQGSGE